MSDLKLDDGVVIADNEHYQFCVARNGERWVGFAIGKTTGGQSMMFFFPEIAEGYRLGLASREEAIRMTAAIAQDPGHSFGGVGRWFIPEELRASPEDYRCRDCDEVGCRGECRDDVWPDDEYPI